MVWHADNTHGENLIIAVILDYPSGLEKPYYGRPVLIMFNVNSNMKTVGDEMIKLYPCQGDAYIMDSKYLLNIL